LPGQPDMRSELVIWAVVRNVGLMLVLGFVVFIAVFPIVGYMAEIPPLRFLNSPFPTNDPVGQDEALSTIVERCNDAGQVLTTTVARRLVNDDSGQLITLPPGGGIVDPGCTTVTGGIGLPQNVPPGRYHVEQIVSVEGRWKTHQIPLRTQSFTVVPGEP
jgi:hypothetical protein